MSIELTDDDVRVLVDTARAALRQSAQQIGQLRKGFPNTTDAHIAAMAKKLRADPAIGQRQQPIDAAAYFLALHELAHGNAQDALRALATNGTPATLHYVFVLMTNCANIVNALTLLQAGGGLATQLHIEEMQGVALSTARHKSAAHAANERHNQPGGYRELHAKVRAAWASGEYTSRDDCAGKVHRAIGLSLSAARRALRGTPEPTRT